MPLAVSYIKVADGKRTGYYDEELCDKSRMLDGFIDLLYVHQAPDHGWVFQYDPSDPTWFPIGIGKWRVGDDIELPQ